ncbi:MAG: hypothetical protein IBX55_08845 [Methyloprofundus sp.]|nr:hypothetical protein [Methyloprofundus sp.]
MAVITLAADSTTLTLNGHVFTSFMTGDLFTLTPANPHSAHVNSQAGGVSIQRRSDGNVYDLPVRIQKFSDDDIFLNSALAGDKVVIFNGSAKENFNKNGVDGVETYLLENGSITTQPTNAKNDQDGNALMEYTLRFRSVSRAL